MILKQVFFIAKVEKLLVSDQVIINFVVKRKHKKLLMSTASPVLISIQFNRLLFQSIKYS